MTRAPRYALRAEGPPGDPLVELTRLSSANDVHRLMTAVTETVVSTGAVGLVLDLGDHELDPESVEALATVRNEARQLGVRLSLEHVHPVTEARLDPPLDPGTSGG